MMCAMVRLVVPFTGIQKQKDHEASSRDQVTDATYLAGGYETKVKKGPPKGQVAWGHEGDGP